MDINIDLINDNVADVDISLPSGVSTSSLSIDVDSNLTITTISIDIPSGVNPSTIDIDLDNILETTVTIDLEPNPSVSPSPSPSVSPSPSPSPNPVSRLFTVACPVYPLFGVPQVDLILTDIEDTNITNASLDDWFYLDGPAFSGCAKISDLNPDIPTIESSAYWMGTHIDFGSYTYTPYPSGQISCLDDHPC